MNHLDQNYPELFKMQMSGPNPHLTEDIWNQGQGMNILLDNLNSKLWEML